MTTDLSAALARMLKIVDDHGLDYVVYSDKREQDRLVLIVQGIDDPSELKHVLMLGGAASETYRGPDLVLTVTDASGATEHIVVEVKASSAKSGVANLLWRAASEEGALSARSRKRRALGRSRC
jgi:hypothetical protein